MTWGISRSARPAWAEGEEDLFAPDVEQVRVTNDRLVKTARLALYVAIFFSAYNVLRVGTINLTLSDLAFLFALVILAMIGRVNMMPFRSATPFWLIGLALMLSGLFISTMVNGDPTRWLIVAAQYIVAFLLIPLVLMGQERSFTKRLIVAFVAGAAVSQAIGIVSTFLFTFRDTVGLLGTGFITGSGRLGAMSGQPNSNGAVIAFAFPMLIYALHNRLMPKLAGIACAFLLVWGLLLSASFTGFAASVIAVFISLLITGLRHLVRAALGVAIAGALFVASGAPLPKAFQERVGGAVTSGDLDQAGTFTDRSELAQEAWAYAEDTMLIGMGVDRYREVSDHGAPVHVLHLLIWTEGGGPAFAGLLILLFLMVILASGKAREARQESAMALAVVVVFLIYTMSTPHMYSRLWVMPIMLGLSTIYAMRSANPAPRFEAETAGAI